MSQLKIQLSNEGATLNDRKSHHRPSRRSRTRSDRDASRSQRLRARLEGDGTAKENQSTDSSSNSSDSTRSQSNENEFSASMARLETAVQDLVTVTAGQLGERATSLIDDTSKRLEAELRLRRVTDDPEQDERHKRRRRRHRSRHGVTSLSKKMRRTSSRLVRNPADEKVAGVCSGLAPYFGVDTWKVRLGAVTGMLFLPQIVFPAYWILYFVMEDPRKGEHENYASDNADFVDPDELAENLMNENEEQNPSAGLSSGSSRRARRKAEKAAKRRAAKHKSAQSPQSQRDDFNPRRSMQYANIDLTQAELRLRRLESFVTSDQYELQKGLAQISKEQEAQHNIPHSKTTEGSLKGGVE